MTNGALLVGSVPFETADEVFRTAGGVLGDRLRRIPDGEVEDRRSWIEFLPTVFALDREHLYFRTPATLEAPPSPLSLGWFKLRPGRRAADVRFPTLRYAQWATESYATFARLHNEGAIPDAVRFQVDLPAITPVPIYFDRAIQAEIEPAYVRAMLAEVKEIAEAIPHDDLAIQWDLPYETTMWDGQLAAVMPPYWEGDAKEGVLERLKTFAEAVPADVELGMHLFYGDRGNRHAVQPRDAAAVTELMSRATDAIGRPVTFWHFPVPIERDDDAFFAPLADLRIGDDAELYVGLVHREDGVEGARRRIETASRHLPHPFGVATECGFGRQPSDAVVPLLEIHRDVTAPRQAGAGSAA